LPKAWRGTPINRPEVNGTLSSDRTTSRSRPGFRSSGFPRQSGLLEAVAIELGASGEAPSGAAITLPDHPDLQAETES
jgi:hypothetical protein